MKKYIVLCFLFLFASNVFAQKTIKRISNDTTRTNVIKSYTDTTAGKGTVKFEDTYIVDINGDTVFGSIDSIRALAESLATKATIDQLGDTASTLRALISSSSSAENSIIIGHVGDTVTVGDWVYIPSDSDTVFYRAKANDTSTVRIAGIAMATAGPGVKDSIQIYGYFENVGSWSFNAGEDIFLDTAAGGGQPYPPSPSGSGTTVVLRVGRAVESDKIIIIIGEPLYW